MKSAVLARPNLKFFVISAVVMVILQHLLTNGLLQSVVSAGLITANGRQVTDAQLEDWLQRARQEPSAAAYVRISNAYEQRGDYKRALQYLRRAEKLGFTEDATE